MKMNLTDNDKNVAACRRLEQGGFSRHFAPFYNVIMIFRYVSISNVTFSVFLGPHGAFIDQGSSYIF